MYKTDVLSVSRPKVPSWSLHLYDTARELRGHPATPCSGEKPGTEPTPRLRPHRCAVFYWRWPSQRLTTGHSPEPLTAGECGAVVFPLVCCMCLKHFCIVWQALKRSTIWFAH